MLSVGFGVCLVGLGTHGNARITLKEVFKVKGFSWGAGVNFRVIGGFPCVLGSNVWNTKGAKVYEKHERFLGKKIRAISCYSCSKRLWGGLTL